jgi:hypothetical protein
MEVAQMADDKGALIVGGYGRINDGLPVFASSGWEDHLQAWLDAEHDVSAARWRQAAIAYSLVTHYGDHAVEKFAAQIGIAPRRVWEYRSVYALVKDRERPQNLDFTHYVIASSAPDPQQALEVAADQSLSTRALRRMIASQSAGSIEEAIPGLSENPAIAQAWQQARSALVALRSAAPRLTGLISGYIEEIEYELSCPADTIRNHLLTAIRQGHDTVDILAAHLRRDRDHIRVWLNRLAELGEVEHAERRVGARGPAEVYWIVTEDK